MDRIFSIDPFFHEQNRMLGFKSEPNKNYAVESTCATKFLKIQLQARSKLWSGIFLLEQTLFLIYAYRKMNVEQTACPLEIL